MRRNYEIRAGFKVHPTQHVLVATVDVRYQTFSSMETLFSIDGEPGSVSEDDVKVLIHKAKYLLMDYSDQWREANNSWDIKTIEYMEVEG